MNYSVSEYGDVYSKKTNKLLKPENISGYNRITLVTGSRISKRKIFIHHLVFICFLIYDVNIYSIDHIDRNKTNNHYSNLRQASMKENNNNRKNMIRKINNEKDIVILGERWKKYTTKEGNSIEISDKGRIKSGNIITKGRLMEKGYYTYNSFLVHRLVAEVFIGNPDNNNNMIVNHINGVKTDNRIENLEWISQKENTIHGHQLKTSNILKSVEQYNDKGNIIAKYPSIQKASEYSDINRSNIEYSLNHSVKAGGFLWKYSDEKVYDVWQDETLKDTDFKYKKTKFSRKPVVQKDISGKIINKYKNMEEASKSTGISVNEIKQSAKNNEYIIKEFLFEL